MTYIRQPLRGFPIRYKIIKGKKYAYQRIEAFRERGTGKVVVRDRYLGPVAPARPKPMLDELSAATQRTIMAAYRHGEPMSRILAYLKAHAGIETTPNTVYVWLREKGVLRSGARQRTTKRATTIEQRLEQIKRLRKEEAEIRARQAQRRAQMRKKGDK